MKAKCIRNDGYEYDLTVGQIYEIEVQEGIFETDPYASGKGDRIEKGFVCHLRRFRNLDGTEIKYDRTNE